SLSVFFFFQAEDGIRDFHVTGVQTCALPILFENGAYHTDFQARSHYPARQQNLEAMRPQVQEVSPGVVFDDGHVKISVDWVEHRSEERRVGKECGSRWMAWR